jgi:membrane protease subunit (stomatin/prohibitin family)
LQNGITFDFTDPGNDVATQLFTEVIASLAGAFSAYTNDPANGNRISNIQRDSVGFAASLSSVVEDSFKWTSERGVAIEKVAIVGIEYDEPTKELLKTVQRADALSGSRGNSNLQASVAAGLESAGSVGGSAGGSGGGASVHSAGKGGQAETANQATNGSNGQVGSTTTGAAGGPSVSAEDFYLFSIFPLASCGAKATSGAGGAGGNLGQAGLSPTSTTNSSSIDGAIFTVAPSAITAAASTGGAAGRAIVGVSNITFTNAGDIRGAQV